MEFEKFNEQDLIKVRKDKNNNILYSAGVFLILVLITFLILFFNTTYGVYYAISIIISAIVSFIFFKITTRKHRLDILNQNVLLIKSAIKDKVYKKDYEPGSASLPSQIIDEMKELNIYYIVIDDTKIFVNKEDYDKVDKGEEIICRWSENTKLFLGIKKGNQFINISQTSGVNQLYV